MIRFLGDLLPCIVLSYILFKKRKAYSLALLIVFGFNLLNIHVLKINLDNNPFIFYMVSAFFIMGIILFYKDYKKKKNI